MLTSKGIKSSPRKSKKSQSRWSKDKKIFYRGDERQCKTKSLLPGGTFEVDATGYVCDAISPILIPKLDDTYEPVYQKLPKAKYPENYRPGSILDGTYKI